MVSEKQLEEAFLRRYKPRKEAPEIWALLKEDRAVGPACEYEDVSRALDCLFDEIRTNKKRGYDWLGGRMPPGRSATSSPFHVIELRPEEHRRAAIVERWVVKEAGAEEQVRRFRDLLPGRLTEKDARAFVMSPATAVLRSEDFVELDPWDRNVDLEWSEERRTAQGWEGRCSLVIDPPGESTVVEAGVAFPIHDPLPTLPWPARDGSTDRIPFWPGSVLDRLQRISHDLAGRYLLSPQDAAWFVLTGDPRMEPVRVWTEVRGGECSGGVITISAAPWVNAKTVDATFRQFQNGMLRGKDNRAPVEGLDVFNFVEDRLGAGEEPELKQIAAEWDETVPPDRAYAYPDKFGETYRRTKDKLLRSNYDVTAYGKGRSMPGLGNARRVQWLPVVSDDEEVPAGGQEHPSVLSTSADE